MDVKIELPDEAGKIISFELRRANFERRRMKKTCAHDRVLINTALAELECLDCGSKLNPIEFMANLVEQWRHVDYLYKRYKAIKEHIDTRTRIKCRHCGKFNQI